MLEDKDIRDIIPKKIFNPTSLEDVGWNSCCEQMERNLDVLKLRLTNVFGKEDRADFYLSLKGN
jgi:hypothetical protein